MIAVEDHDSMVETLAVRSDPEAMADIRQAERDIAAGDVHGEAEVRAAFAARRA